MPSSRISARGGLRWLRILAVCLFALVFTTAAVRALDQTGAQTKTSLWSVQAGSGRVYLLGSVHFLRQGDYPLPAAMEQAYADSSTVVFETDLGAMASPEVQADILRLGVYPENENIFQHLSAGTSEMLKQKLAELGFPESLVSRLKPWTTAMTLEVMTLKLMGFDEQAGVDFHFYRKAPSEGKNVAFLETVDYQLNLLAGLDAANQDALLRQTLRELDRIEELAPKMVAFWRTGDFRRLGTLSPMPPHLRERLLIRRNQNWLGSIDSYLNRQENTLVIVGALHLAGPNSVLDLLRRSGYTVVQH